MVSSSAPPPAILAIPLEWWIGLPSWMIQDGSMPPVAVRQQLTCAIRFDYSRSARLEVADSDGFKCEYAGRGTWYNIVAMVKESTDRSTRIDFGLVATSIGPISLAGGQSVSPGLRVRGAVLLEFLPDPHLLPEPRYVWEVREIRAFNSSDPDLWHSADITPRWEDARYEVRCSLREGSRGQRP